MLRARLSRDMARLMTEDELLEAVTDAATYLGWRWHHVRRSDEAKQMGHSGFPDLVLARAGAIKFWELKSQRGVASADQLAWLFELAGTEPGPVLTEPIREPLTGREVRLVLPENLDSALVSLGARIVGADEV